MLKIKKILSLAIFVIISLSLFTLSVYGVNKDTAKSGKSEEGFSESRVLVVIDRDESLKFNDYSIRDFSEVDCIKITDLTADMKSKTESAVKEGNSGDISFNRILCLELREHGKDKVLDAIEKLRDNEHIVSAAPDYTMKVCMTPNDTYLGVYYGNFSGCDVYFKGGCLDVLTRIPVGDYVFGYPNSACLTVYKDGRSCDISEAYGRGMLSDCDIAELHDIHKAYLAKDGIDAELYERCE